MPGPGPAKFSSSLHDPWQMSGSDGNDVGISAADLQRLAVHTVDDNVPSVLIELLAFEKVLIFIHAVVPDQLRTSSNGGKTVEILRLRVLRLNFRLAFLCLFQVLVRDQGRTSLHHQIAELSEQDTRAHCP